MAYTTIKKPSDYFNTLLWVGDGTSPRNITGVGFQPDLVWVKNRDAVRDAARDAVAPVINDRANDARDAARDTARDAISDRASDRR